VHSFSCPQVINSYVASSLPWPEIKDIIDEATALNDPVAKHISKLSLEQNHITLSLEFALINFLFHLNPIFDLTFCQMCRDVAEEDGDDSDLDDLASDYDSENEEMVAAEAAKAKGKTSKAKKAGPQAKTKPTKHKIDIDLAITAYANAARVCPFFAAPGSLS
jgi:hypothetical protein